MKELKKRMVFHELINVESLLQYISEFESVQYDSLTACKEAFYESIQSVKKATKHLKADKHLLDCPLPTPGEIKEMFESAGWEKVDSVDEIEYFTFLHGKEFKARLFPDTHRFSEASRNHVMIEFESWKEFKKMINE